MKELSGHTLPFAVLGHPIGHTLSPVMHNASLRALGRDAIYLAFDVAPDQLLTVLPAMRAMGFGGVNLTVPLKEVAYARFADLDESAQLVGAVNTVAFPEAGGMRGYNTDGYGFLTAMQEACGTSVEGQAVHVIGTGGAGRALALVCARAGARSLTCTDVDATRAERVATEIRTATPDCPVTTVDAADQVAATRAADIIIQSTPVGMRPEDPPLLGSEAFRSGQLVFDLIYMYPETALMKAARAAGAETANGLGMLLHQGARAYTIWTGDAPDTDAMRAALEKAVYGE